MAEPQTTTSTETTVVPETTTSFKYQLCGYEVIWGIVEGVGRPYDDDGLNGYQTPYSFDFAFDSKYSRTECPFESSNNSDLIEKFMNYGDTLSQVRDDIFLRNQNIQEGPDGRIFATWTRKWLDYRWEIASYNPNGGELTLEITDVIWHTAIVLPEWENLPTDLPSTELAEWYRFHTALKTHEQGHVDIYKQDMLQVRASVVGKTVTLSNIAELPEIDGTIIPYLPAASGTVLQLIKAAMSEIFMQDAKYLEMIQHQIDYDAPVSLTNPNGTNHGREQNATLYMSTSAPTSAPTWTPP
jgi:hypothetical protein